MMQAKQQKKQALVKPFYIGIQKIVAKNMDAGTAQSKKWFKLNCSFT